MWPGLSLLYMDLNIAGLHLFQRRWLGGRLLVSCVPTKWSKWTHNVSVCHMACKQLLHATAGPGSVAEVLMAFVCIYALWCIRERAWKGKYRGAGRLCKPWRRPAEMLHIVTATLFKQQLIVKCRALPPASLGVLNRPSKVADSKLGEAMTILTVRTYGSLTEGPSKQLRVFLFQVYLKSSWDALSK